MKSLSPYRYKRHSIEPLPSRVCGSDGWLYWLVCPDNGAESWYARSLAEARESIRAEALAQEVAPGWECAGSVAVDGGRLLLIDPGYDTPSDLGLELAVRASDLPCAEVALSEKQLHTAFVCQTGIGDGIYPVFVRMAPNPIGSGEVVAEMRVVFLEDEADTFGPTAA